MLNLAQVELFVLVGLVIALLLTERVRNDIVGLLVILALYLTGLLSSQEALSGFGSAPAIVVVGMFVLGAGVRQTQLDETIGSWVGRMAGQSYGRALAVIMPAVALLSAFTNDVTTTAVMLPVTLNLSRERNIPASKLLIPLSFAASLGTTITLIGAPAFLIASDVLQRSGRPPLGVLSVAPVGIIISLVGALFMILIGRWMLPSHEAPEDQANLYRLDKYLTEVSILPDSSLVGQTLDHLQVVDGYELDIIGWMHGGKRLVGPFDSRELEGGDVLLVRASSEEMASIHTNPALTLKPIAKYGRHESSGLEEEDPSEQLVQVVVAPASDLIGRSIGAIDFRERYGVLVVGIWRQRGNLDQELSQVRLRAGDVLVLEGDAESLNCVRDDPAFLMMVPFQGEVHFRSKAPLAALILLGTILIAALNIVTLEMAVLGGAVAMVLSRCVTTRQAYRAIDYRIYVFIAGAIPLGAAMEKTGASTTLATWLQGAIGGWNEFAILFVLFIIVGILTQFMDDAAATAVFAPVAVALAGALNRPPEPFVVVVMMAAVAAFLTPFGHNGNLLVYGPGRYRFSDFVKVGTPLTVLVAIVVVLLAPLLWGH